MAQDERKIVIVIKSEGGSGSGENQTGKPEQDKLAVDDDGNKSQGVALAAWAVKSLVSEAVSVTLTHAKYEIDKNLNLDDNYMAQRDMGIALQMIGKTTGLLSSIAGSAISGAMVGGPIGAAVGAVVGTVTSIASNLNSKFQALDQENIMLNQMDAQLGYTRQRAGWSTQAASIGEDL